MDRIADSEKDRRAKIASTLKSYWAEKVRNYESNPDKCIHCAAPISYSQKVTGNQFCSRSCSATHNNLGVRRNFKDGRSIRNHSVRDLPVKWRVHPCPICGQDTTWQTCSWECSRKRRKLALFSSIEAGCYHPKGTSGSSARVLKAYLEEKFGRKCFCCSMTEWMGKPVPLDVHHVDGDCSNNAVSNLQLLCKNCHALTDNFGSKNKNGSRKWRRTYERGKHVELTRSLSAS